MHRCADRGTCRLSFLGISPSSRLFEVASRPPLDYSRLTSTALFPPGECPSSPGATSADPPYPPRLPPVGVARVVVSQLAQLILPMLPLQRSRPTLRVGRWLCPPASLPSAALTVANDRIAVQLSPHERVPIASVVPRGARWFGDYDDTDGRGGCA